MAIASEKAREAVHSIFGDKVILDGELQFDAAYVPSVAAKKGPEQSAQRQRTIFIFPDLGRGNLCYKSNTASGGGRSLWPIDRDWPSPSTTCLAAAALTILSQPSPSHPSRPMDKKFAAFVVHEHRTPMGIHWDLMLRKGDVLWTWRMDCSPAEIGKTPCHG
jgi:hypothetical protein